MRIALIACPAWANWAPNPALLLLRAQLRREGHETRLWDLNIETYRAVSEAYKPWWLDENSVKWEQSAEVERLFRDHAAFFAAKAEEIAAFAPGMVGLTINSGARCTSPLFARILRARLPWTPIVFGGADCFRSEHFTKYMEPGIVDALCSGEGDFVLPELARAIEETGRVPLDQNGFCVWENGAIRDNGDPRRPEDLDVLAPIDIDDVDLSIYTLQNRVTMSISRGCTKRCAFCSEGRNFFEFRTHTADWMVAQLESILPAIRARSGQVPHVNFNDSLINGNVQVMSELCDAILARGLEFTWGGMAIVRAEMTRELLGKMRRAGCVEICWGVESGSAWTLKKMGKGVTVSLMDQVVRTAAAAGIMQYGNIIVGFPGEKPKHFAESMLFAAKNIRYFGCLGLPVYTPAKNSTVFKSPHLFGMANLDVREWRTEDSENTPAIRVLRRDVLAMIFADKKFDQGRFDALASKYAVDLGNEEQRGEFKKLFREYAAVVQDYLAQAPALLAEIAEDKDWAPALDLALERRGPLDLSDPVARDLAYRRFAKFLDLTIRFFDRRADALPLLKDNVPDEELRSKHFVRGRMELIQGGGKTLESDATGLPKAATAGGQWMTVGGGRSRAAAPAAAAALSREALLERKRANIRLCRETADEIRAGKTDVRVRNLPIELFVELTKRCNIACPMCSNPIQVKEHVERHGRATLDFPADRIGVYDPLLETAAMAYTVGIGEPTLHPALPEFVRRCSEKGVFTWTNSNAVLIKEDLARRLVDAGLSRLVVSASGGTRESYERYHKPAKWERLWAAVERVHREKIRRSATWPELFLNYVVMDDNVAEIPRLLGQLQAFDFAGMTVKPVVNMRGVLDSREDAPKRRAPAAEDAAILAEGGETARRLGMAWEVHSFTETHRAADKADGVCLHPFSTLYVNPLGDAYPCAPGETMVGEALKIGNVNERSVEEIWFGEKANAVRARMLRRDYLDGCRECISKQLCRLSNDVEDGFRGLEIAAENGCRNPAPEPEAKPALPAAAPKKVKEGELLRLDELTFLPTGEPVAKPEEERPGESGLVEWPAPPPAALLRHAKRKNYARYMLTMLEGRTEALNTPLEVFLASADACNLSCRFCAITIKEPRPMGKTAIMDGAIMRAVAPWLPGAASMSFTGFGEPFMNRNLLGSVAAAVGHGSRVEFFTNGKMLSEERAIRTIESGLPNLFVSISSADPETYERLYVDGRFDKLRANLLFLKEEKARRGAARPEVIFNTIVMRSTLEGLPKLVRFAAETGVVKVDLKPLVTYDGIPDLHGERVHYEPERDDPILAECERLGRELGVEVGTVSYRASGLPAKGASVCADPTPDTGREWRQRKEPAPLEKPCPLVFRTTYVGVSGNVKPCCFAADDPELSLGNVKERTIHEIWNGEKYRELRRSHLEGRVPPPCAHCVKFKLYPKSDEADAWLAAQDVPVYNALDAAEAFEALRAGAEELREGLRAWVSGPGAARDANAFLPAYRGLAASIKALGRVAAELRIAAERLPGIEAVRDEAAALEGRLAAAGAEAGAAVQEGRAEDLAARVQERIVPFLADAAALERRAMDALKAAYLTVGAAQLSREEAAEARGAPKSGKPKLQAWRGLEPFDETRTLGLLAETEKALAEDLVARLAEWLGAAGEGDPPSFEPVQEAIGAAQRAAARTALQLEAGKVLRSALEAPAAETAAVRDALTNLCLKCASLASGGDTDLLADAIKGELIPLIASWPGLADSVREALPGAAEAPPESGSDLPTETPEAIRSRGPGRTFYRSGGLWSDRLDAEEILRSKRERGIATPEEADALARFLRDGYVILPKAVPEAAVDAVNRAVERSWAGAHPEMKLDLFGKYERIAPQWRQKKAKLLDLYGFEPAALEALFAEPLRRMLSILFERDVLLFQSLSFEYGTEQAIHQDTAYVVVSRPLELAAAWIALEDIRPGTGELEYYPGSHRFDEYFYGVKRHWDPSQDGERPHETHLAYLHQEAARRGIQRARFLARKGDVLIWAADLAHGGSAITDHGTTRRSLVGHFCPFDVAPHYFGYLPEHRLRMRRRAGCWYASSHYLLRRVAEERPALAANG